jgi:signal transduction histidine kinase
VSSIDPPHLRVAAVARGFVLLALAFPVAWSRDDASIVSLLGVAGVCALVTAADFQPDNIGPVLTVLEAVGISIIGALSAHNDQPVLGALVMVPFVAGVYRGIWGVVQALCAEVAALVPTLVIMHTTYSNTQVYNVFSWVCTGLGLGLVGAFLNTALQERSELASHHYAQGLLHQLISISDGLESDIDPTILGGAILADVQAELPTSALVLYVPRGDTLTPLVTREISPADRSRCEEVAIEAWVEGRDVLRDRFFALPLLTDSGTPGVVVAALSDRVDAVVLQVDQRLRRLHDELQERAVHLDTALLFAAFRDSATAEERRRLAREMHDGVAQDIASLGYLVDVVQAAERDPRQLERIGEVRGRITAIVAEIRRSLVNLRTSVGEHESLGAAIAAFARHLSESSRVPIHVTADERTDRLRPEVEAELFRIAQEAINNAVKHARASTIEVTCQVRAPAARITVSDDGRGLQAGRSDSHGLAIMRERATLINACLDIDPTPSGGLTVTVTLPAAPPTISATALPTAAAETRIRP